MSIMFGHQWSYTSVSRSEGYFCLSPQGASTSLLLCNDTAAQRVLHRGGQRLRQSQYFDYQAIQVDVVVHDFAQRLEVQRTDQDCAIQANRVGL